MSTPLTITLDIERAERVDDPFAFRWTSTSYVRRLSTGARRVAELSWDERLSSDLAQAEDPGAAERLGASLRRFLLELGWADDESAVQAAAAAGLAVTLTLELAAAELYALPWELCHVGEAGRQLANLNVIQLRYAWPGVRSAPSPRQREGGRLLLAWSASGGGVPTNGHLSAIREPMLAAGLPFDESADVLGNASFEGLGARLAAAKAEGRPYAVLHLLAHGAITSGKAAGVQLDDGTRDGAALRELLADYAEDLRLVVLCVCHSGDAGVAHPLGSLAWQVHRAGVANVIASRQALSVPGSTLLSRTLYSALLTADPPLSLDAALGRARAALRASTNPGDATSLQRYAGQDVGPDTRPFVFRPYRGLLAFGPEHRRFFFGRDGERDELCREIQAQIADGSPRISIVEGASGSGKSSLVLAAVAPALQDQGWRFARMVPGSSPLAALDAALSPLMMGAPGQRRLLVVDQLEEIFTQLPEDRRAEADSFVRRLWALATEAQGGDQEGSNPAGSVSVVATLRADFRGRCGELRLNDALRLDILFTSEHRGHHVFVPVLGSEALRAAIEGPARAVGLRLEDGLISRLIDDVNGEPGALPLLQFTLDQLWILRADDVLTQDACDRLGSVSGALRAQADAVLGRLDERGLALARRVLVRLVSHSDGAQDTRRSVAISTLRPLEDAKRLDVVIDLLTSERLLVRNATVQDNGDATVEVAHEALIRSWPRLRGWVNEDRARLVEVDKVEALATRWLEFPAELLGDDALGYARQVRDNGVHDLSPAATDLIQKSEDFLVAQRAAEQARLTRERRRSRIQLVVASAASVILAGAALFAFRLSESASRAREIAVEAEQQAIVARDDARRVRFQVTNENHVATTFRDEEDPMVQVALVRDLYGRIDPGEWRQMAMDALRQRVARKVITLGGEIAVNGVQLSADGQRLVTRTAGGAVEILEVDRPDTRLRLGGPDRSFRNMRVHNGESILTTDAAGLVQQWEWDGRERRRWTTPGGPADVALLSKDEQLLVVASGEDDLRVLSPNGAAVALSGRPGDLSALGITDDGLFVAVSAGDRILVWRATGGPPRTLQGTGSLGPVAISPAGGQIAAATDDGQVTIWSVDGASEPITLSGHEGRVGFLAFSPDGRWLASGARDKTVRIWDTRGESSPRVFYDHSDGVTSGEFLADGTLLTASIDGTVRIWNGLGVYDSTVLRGHFSPIYIASASADGETLVTYTADGTARIWDIGASPYPQTRQVALQQSGTDALREVLLSPDGQWLAWLNLESTDTGWGVGLARLDGSAPARWLGGNDNFVTDLDFSPDGRSLTTASREGEVKVWSLEQDTAPVVMGSDLVGWLQVDYSSDGTRFVTTSNKDTVLIRSPDGLDAPVSFKAPCKTVNYPRFSPSSRHVAVGCEGTIRVANADGIGQGVDLLHPATLMAMRYGETDDVILAGYADGALLRWDPSRPDNPVEIGHLGGTVTALALSPDGAAVAAADSTGAVGLWALNGERAPWSGRQMGIASDLAFSPDGQRLLSESTDHNARLWTFDDQPPILLRGALKATHSPAFTSDGSRMLVASDDGSIRIWPMDMDTASLLTRLWGKTATCLSPEQRGRLLGEDQATASAGALACSARSQQALDQRKPR